MAQLFKRKPQNTTDIGTNLALQQMRTTQGPDPSTQQSTVAQNEAARKKKFAENEATSANRQKNDPFFLQKRVAAQIEPNNQQAAAMQGDIAQQNTALTQANDLQLANRDVAQRQQDIQAAQDQPLPSPSISLGGESNADIAANIGTNLPSIVGGAAGGATLGAIPFLSVPTAGLSIPIGAVIGAATAFFGKLAIDRHQTAKEAIKIFRKTSGTGNTHLLNMAHAGVPAGEVLRKYEQNLANIHESERALKVLTRTATGRQLSQAMDEQIEVEFYLDNEDIYRQNLLVALANPNPAKIQPIPAQDLNLEGG